MTWKDVIEGMEQQRRNRIIEGIKERTGTSIPTGPKSKLGYGIGIEVEVEIRIEVEVEAGIEVETEIEDERQRGIRGA